MNSSDYSSVPFLSCMFISIIFIEKIIYRPHNRKTGFAVYDYIFSRLHFKPTLTNIICMKEKKG